MYPCQHICSIQQWDLFPLYAVCFQAVCLHKFMLRMFPTYIIWNPTFQILAKFSFFFLFLHHTWNLPCAYLRHSSGLTVYLPMNSEMLFTWTVAENGYMNAWSPSLLLWYSTLPISKKVPKSCWQIVSLLWWCAAMLSTFELSAFPFSSLITLLQLEIKIFAVSL